MRSILPKHSAIAYERKVKKDRSVLLLTKPTLLMRWHAGLHFSPKANRLAKHPIVFEHSLTVSANSGVHACLHRPNTKGPCARRIDLRLCHSFLPPKALKPVFPALALLFLCLRSH